MVAFSALHLFTQTALKETAATEQSKASAGVTGITSAGCAEYIKKPFQKK